MSRRQLRGLVFVPVVLGLLSLVPLAHATPPDPVWIAGSYDAADLDAALLAATSVVAAVAAQKAAPRAQAGWVVVEVARRAEPVRCAGALPSEGPSFTQSVALSSGIIRSPPAP